jgi:hypothetical protein
VWRERSLEARCKQRQDDAAPAISSAKVLGG